LKILEVENLSKNFDGFKAVKEASFSLEKGEIFGFLGLTVLARPRPLICLLVLPGPLPVSLK